MRAVGVGGFGLGELGRGGVKVLNLRSLKDHDRIAECQ